MTRCAPRGTKLQSAIFFYCLLFIPEEHLQLFEFLDTDYVASLDSQGVEHLTAAHLSHRLKENVISSQSNSQTPL